MSEYERLDCVSPLSAQDEHFDSQSITHSLWAGERSQDYGTIPDLYRLRLPGLTVDDYRDDNERTEKKHLDFDYSSGRHPVIVSITLPDGGKVTRETEELPGRDKGNYVLTGYRMPDGTLVEKDIQRNTDGSISVLDIDSDARHPDRHEVRMSEDEFISWVGQQQRKR